MGFVYMYWTVVGVVEEFCGGFFLSSWGIYAAALAVATRQIEVCSPLDDCCSRIKKAHT